MPAKRVHSRYTRKLADLPWGEHAVIHRVRLRRMFCDNGQCQRRIFTERLPEVAAPWARRTSRAATRLTRLGLALGGSAGSRLGREVGLPASRNTLIRHVRRVPLPEASAPRVLGVDDWAMRKRHRYGTVLVDLECRRPLALLPDRTSVLLTGWLREHPGVEVISRDRSGAYSRGAREGAPSAIQVADRFHLLQNFASALEAALAVHSKALRGVTPDTGTAIVIAPRELEPRTRASTEAKWQRRQAEHEAVWALRDAGVPGDEIARRVGISRATVYRYLGREVFPDPARRGDAGRSMVNRWSDKILARWNAGQRQARHLHAELKAEGWRGSYSSLARYLGRLRKAAGTPMRPRAWRKPAAAIVRVRPLTPKTVAWTMVRQAGKRNEADAAMVERLRADAPALRELIDAAETFVALVRNRDADRLDPWLRHVQDGASPVLRRFAEKLVGDYDAVRAAVTLPWSNGQVEGQINRLKLLKRQMYGRAKLDLLSRRFLLAA